MLRFGMSFTASAEERLVTPLTRSPKRLYLASLAVCLAAHAALIFVLLVGDRPDLSAPPASEEVDVELVQEPPPPPPAPEPAPPEEPKPPEPAPPKSAASLDEKPAFDAPKTVSEKENPLAKAEQAAKSPEVAAKPAEQSAPPVPQPAQTPPTKSATAENKPAATPEPPEEKPDAEALAPMELRPGETPQPPPPAAAASQPKQKSMADILATFEPLPTYEFGGAVRPSPVAGGQSTATYLSIIFGLVKAHLRMPTGPRPGNGPLSGDITFEIDRAGRLIRAGVTRSSGSGALDAAAMAAIRAASPFPPTPTGTPLGLIYSYSAK